MDKKIFSAIATKIIRLDRCNAFADGVFAIIVTLLVLGIEIPTDHSFSEAFLSIPLYYLSFPIIDHHEAELMENK